MEQIVSGVVFGKPCKAVDFRGQLLSWEFIPLRLAFDNKYVECQTPLGGLVHIKPEDLRDLHFEG